ncbi:unnamed protein product [Vitrella brassicaformis CCMP3155]|uniref:Apple domain-containing protein n=1 Tax=Vitrella brassicaformis (strain CCMP3155) TaxID=1169540 RepID=A0A0G4EDK7_VITBC|nr:unnamed protein product [Vitrella brassicaformis CCMP3155]|eukprot:CEL93805.1 unnamed protein product [Vitrella brassicaformis CCMP3155]
MPRRRLWLPFALSLLPAVAHIAQADLPPCAANVRGCEAADLKENGNGTEGAANATAMQVYEGTPSEERAPGEEGQEGDEEMMDIQRAREVWGSDPIVGEFPRLTNETIEALIASIVAKMTLEQKVGQMVQGEAPINVNATHVKTYALGSVLSGGMLRFAGSTDPHTWLDHTQAYFDEAVEVDGHKVRVLWAIDAVHGHNKMPGATIFPHNIGLGATRDPALVEKVGKVTAHEVALTGIDWNFAPCLAVPQNERWGRTYEGYSEDPKVVETLGAAYVRGLQGEPGNSTFLDLEHVIGTAKHFIGDGGTGSGADRGNTKVTEETLRDIHGRGYLSTLKQAVQTVMTSYSRWNNVDMHNHKYLITDVLKGVLGFDGIVVSDWYGMDDVPGCDRRSCAPSINAGIDIMMVPDYDHWRPFIRNTIRQVEIGLIPQERIDDAVTRILRVKARMGLIEPKQGTYEGVYVRPSPSKRTEELRRQGLQLSSPEHREVAREAVQKSLVLLKNNKAARTGRRPLPLAKDSVVLVAGRAADSIPLQAGGWTFMWQGDMGKDNSFFKPGQSILDGLEGHALDGGGKVIYDSNGTETHGDIDVAIVVMSEQPYAEMLGDRPFPSPLAFNATEDGQVDHEVLHRVKASHPDVPLVAILLSGRALYINNEINAADAFVAAWLIGTEGQGVADVLYENGPDFHGRLPYTWPSHPCQVPVGAEQPSAFPLGYGLSYEDEVHVEPLPEDAPSSCDAFGDFEMVGSSQCVVEMPDMTPDALLRVTEDVTISMEACATLCQRSGSCQAFDYLPTARKCRRHFFALQSTMTADGLVVGLAADTEEDTERPPAGAEARCWRRIESSVEDDICVSLGGRLAPDASALCCPAHCTACGHEACSLLEQLSQDTTLTTFPSSGNLCCFEALLESGKLHRCAWDNFIFPPCVAEPPIEGFELRYLGGCEGDPEPSSGSSSDRRLDTSLAPHRRELSHRQTEKEKPISITLQVTDTITRAPRVVEAADVSACADKCRKRSWCAAFDFSQDATHDACRLFAESPSEASQHIRDRQRCYTRSEPSGAMQACFESDGRFHLVDGRGAVCLTPLGGDAVLEATVYSANQTSSAPYAFPDKPCQPGAELPCVADGVVDTFAFVGVATCETRTNASEAGEVKAAEAPDIDACRWLCEESETCTGFQYDYDEGDGSCWLLQRAPIKKGNDTPTSRCYRKKDMDAVLEECVSIGGIPSSFSAVVDGDVEDKPSLRSCCPASCGVCGGADCLKRDGGLDNCCDQAVREHHPLCIQKGSPPCQAGFAPESFELAGVGGCRTAGHGETNDIQGPTTIDECAALCEADEKCEGFDLEVWSKEAEAREWLKARREKAAKEGEQDGDAESQGEAYADTGSSAGDDKEAVEAAFLRKQRDQKTTTAQEESRLADEGERREPRPDSAEVRIIGCRLFHAPIIGGAGDGDNMHRCFAKKGPQHGEAVKAETNEHPDGKLKAFASAASKMEEAPDLAEPRATDTDDESDSDYDAAQGSMEAVDALVFVGTGECLMSHPSPGALADSNRLERPASRLSVEGLRACAEACWGDGGCKGVQFRRQAERRGACTLFADYPIRVAADAMTMCFFKPPLPHHDVQAAQISPGGPSSPSCFLDTYELTSTTIAERSPAESPEACQVECQATPQCAAFTFANGSCLLKASFAPQFHHETATNDTSAAADGRNATSGPRSCGWEYHRSPIRRDDAIEAALDELMQTLDLDSKLGQLIFLNTKRATVDVARALRPGAIQMPRNLTVHEALEANDELYMATLEGGGEHAIPPLLVTNGMHGNAMVRNTTIFPHNIGLGAANDEGLMARIGAATAIEMAVVGLDWTEAPVVAVTRDYRWGRVYESFGEDPERVARLTAAYLRGLQGNPNKTDEYLGVSKVLANCKHFLGDGEAAEGRTKGNFPRSEMDLARTHAPPYYACIDNGVQIIMPSYTGVLGKSVHGSRYLLTEVLREKLGFDGMVISDYDAWRNVEVPVDGCTLDNCPNVISAGVDQLLVGQGSYNATLTNMKTALQQNTLSIRAVNRAVRRILRVKMRLGLMGPYAAKAARQRPSERPLAGRADLVLSSEHRGLAREAVRKSLVLLKNTRGALPLPKRDNHRVLVAGGSAHTKRNQVGSWTLDWQSATLSNEYDLSHTTSVYEGLRRMSRQNGWGKANLRLNGTVHEGEHFDSVVVVVGEQPYTETEGDLHAPGQDTWESLDLAARYPEDMAMARRIRSRLPEARMTVVLLTGRPVYVTPLLNTADAFVVAWLPGGEGGNGVADMLYRANKSYDFSGRLPVSWPMHPCHASHTHRTAVGGNSAAMMFPRGFGLSYSGMARGGASAAQVGQLEEMADGPLDRCSVV